MIQLHWKKEQRILKMICEICKKKIEKPSETPEEAMRKFTLKLKKENKKIKNDKKRNN